MISNPANANEELGARVYDILLALRRADALSEDDLHTLSYACAVPIPQPESDQQRRHRMAREAAQAEARG